MENWEIILKGNRKLKDLLQKEAKKLGLSYTEVSTLYFLRSGEKNVSELAKLIGVNKSTMVEVLDKLDSIGMITRTRDEKDRRVVKVIATDKGIDALNRVRHNYRELINEILNESHGDIVKFFQIVLDRATEKQEN
ncbi:MarR family winged helix-turn-helix transcriptional regulator [Acidianus manzaensis]|uniref:Transcriptional regulator n=1 Tax=Acidianus manzaensis TaxID=282676 RepID=A0A1W6K142_9CREN|nr:MarR family transcriptional regulator [Acidianus manzaensis]ARM76192.1 transcriptional regulator [Acidianus manzaensis]